MVSRPREKTRPAAVELRGRPLSGTRPRVREAFFPFLLRARRRAAANAAQRVLLPRLPLQARLAGRSYEQFGILRRRVAGAHGLEWLQDAAQRGEL